MTELWDENVSNIRFVAWDTETTGSSATNDHLVEIAAVAFDEDFEHRRFERLVRPPCPMPAEVIKIHGITDDMLVGATDSRAALGEFADFLTWVGSPRVLLAHNAGFDVGVIHGEARRLHGQGTRVEASESGELVLDTCMLSKSLLPDLELHRLESLARHFKIEAGRFHRALEDSRVLYQVFLKLLGLAADRFASQGRGLTLSSLVDLAGGYYLLKPSDAGVRSKPFRLSPRISMLEPLCGTTSRVSIEYETDRDCRSITPMAIKMRGFRVYIEAFCHRDNIKKTFRADKILKIGKVEAPVC